MFVVVVVVVVVSPRWLYLLSYRYSCCIQNAYITIDRLDWLLESILYLLLVCCMLYVEGWLHVDSSAVQRVQALVANQGSDQAGFKLLDRFASSTIWNQRL